MRRLLACALLLCACTSDPPAPPPRTTLTVVEEVRTPSGDYRKLVTDLDRPYRARTRVYDQAGRLTGGFVWTEGALFTLKAEGPQRTQDVAPGRTGPDSYLAVALPVAETARRVRRDGTSTVLGIACTWWLSRLPLSQVPLALPDQGSSTRSCVADDGLVLATTETVDGAVTSESRVVALSTTASLTDDELFGGPAPSGGTGLVKVQALTEPPEPPLAVTATAPAGFRFSKGAVTATLEQGEVRLAGDRAVYVRDGRLAVLDEVQDRARPPALEGGEVVEIGALGQGRLTSGYDGLTLRAVTADGVLVTLSGYLTREEILAWGASLRAR